MSVTKYIGISNIGKDIAEKTAQLTAIQVKRLAISKVAVDSGNLKNSIIMSKTRTGYAVFSGSEYALAQEYGLEPYGKPNYTYTPYMRPASIEANAMMGQLVKLASKVVK